MLKVKSREIQLTINPRMFHWHQLHSFLGLHKGCVTKLIIKNVSRPEKYILKIRGNNFVKSREINMRLAAFLPRGLHIA